MRIREGGRLIVGILATTLLSSAGPAAAWNEVGVRLVIEKAADALPKPLKDFYKARRRALADAAAEPRLAEALLYFEIDRLQGFPFDQIPVDRGAAAARYGEEKLADTGELPWKLIGAYRDLVSAFKDVDPEAIESRSAEVAFYASKLHVPLNLSTTGDGDSIDQQGFRERFHSRLLEMFADKLKVQASTAIYLDRPEEHVFSIIRDGYVWVDNLLFMDYLSRVGVTSYDRFYYESLWLRASGVLNERLSRAAESTASYWYTAWVVAGKPDLSKSSGAR